MSSHCADAEQSIITCDEDKPFALLVPTPHGDLIHDVNECAAGFGLAPGQRATDAAAAHDNLAIAYADPEYETSALDRLAAWARRWTPHSRPDGLDGVVLDVTGCTHLFGGDAKMLDTIGERLESMGFTIHMAMAPNHGAAHALARHAPSNKIIVNNADLEKHLSSLPVQALRIDPASVVLLRRLGLKTVGDIARIPRAALKKRFGARTKKRDPRDDTYDDYLGRVTGASSDVLARLDEALGRARKPLNPQRYMEALRVAEDLVEPVMQTEVVLACLRPLIEKLMQILEQRDEGLVALGLEAFRVDGGRASTTLRLSRATRETDRIMRLLIDRLDGWRAEFGFDALAVEAVEVAPLPPSQDDHVSSEKIFDPHALIDRLRTRLGHDAVMFPVKQQSHIPERAYMWLPNQTQDKVSTEQLFRDSSARPDRMFEKPEELGVIHAMPEGPPARFTWRHQTHDVDRVSGPERIAPEWWREHSSVRARDYYNIETTQGRRFWIYRDGFSDDERSGKIRWFMHGLFS